MRVWSRQKLLRRAEAADIAAIMRIERQPGYEELVGRWDAAQHVRNISTPGYFYFVHDDAAGEPDAFAALSGLGGHDGIVMLNRMIVLLPGHGTGTLFLSAIMQTVFEGSPTSTLMLRVRPENQRALNLYQRHGFSQREMLRQAGMMPDGRRVDLLLMAIDYDEWAERSGA